MKIWAINTLFSHSVSSGLARITYNSLGLGCFCLENNFSKLLVLLYQLGLTLAFLFFLFFFLASSIQGLLAPVDCLISHTLCHHVITPAEGLFLKQQPQRQTVVLRKAHLAEGDIQHYRDATCIYV